MCIVVWIFGGGQMTARRAAARRIVVRQSEFCRELVLLGENGAQFSGRFIQQQSEEEVSV
jgi:hypothetical protein